MASSQHYIEQLHATLDMIDLTKVAEAIALFRNVRNAGGAIFVCGNGGSAATASHFATNMVKGGSYGRQQRFRILALTDSAPTLTAYANDLSYDCVFVEQLRNFARLGDLVITISASGNSSNVVCAVEYANSLGCQTLALTGFDGGRLARAAQFNIRVSVRHMGRVEDAHMIVCHMISYYFIDAERASDRKEQGAWISRIDASRRRQCRYNGVPMGAS